MVTLKVSIVLPARMEAKERILHKAEEMFMRFGIRSVSMDDIAAELGMSKKTIYQFFSDKDELVDVVIGSIIRNMQADCLGCKAKSSNAVEQIFMVMDEVIEQFRNMNAMVLYDLEKFHLKAFRQFLTHKNQFLLEIMRENIRWGIEDGLFREDLDVEIMSRLRIESMMIPFNIQAFPPSKYNVADVTKALIEHYLYGLASIKGHKLIDKYKLLVQSKTLAR